MMRTEAMKCLAESARKVILLTDSSKFEKQGVVMQLRFDELQGIVTDSEIPDSAKKLLEDKNIEITIV